MKKIFLFFILAGQVLRAEDPATRAKLLNETLYKRQDVCEDARKADPSKKLALILLSTHLCDAGTHVCLDSLRTLTDPANVFVKNNFVVYQTRFYSFDLDRQGDIHQLYYSGEKQIRDEWNKRDMNPEIDVMDLSSCQVQRGGLIMSYPAALRGNFIDRYLAYRTLITKIPGVEATLGPKSGSPETIKSEMSEIARIRSTGSLEETRSAAYNSMIQESNNANLQVVGMKLFIGGFAAVDDFVKAVRNEYHDSSLDVFITTSGRLVP